MPKLGVDRLLVVLVAGALALGAGCAQTAAAPPRMPLPITFGHGPVAEKDRELYTGPASILTMPPLPVYDETAADILVNLDMTSFRNSTGTDSRPGWRLPADWSFGKLTVHGEVASLERPGDWLISLRIILRTPHGVFACFEDRPENGGTYDAGRVIWIFRGDQNIYRALEGDLLDSTCPSRRDLG